MRSEYRWMLSVGLTSLSAPLWAPRVVGAIIALAAALAGATSLTPGLAQSGSLEATPLKERNIGVSRVRATNLPRSEADQAIVDGWPLYRTESGQAAFNDAMATLKATDGQPPSAAAFQACPELACPLSLPALGHDGWIPAGRLWVSPTDYVLIVHSPRQRSGQPYRRRMTITMRYFVFHEFHNGSRNTDPYDTISSHRSSVFVPFYMSKSQTDANGRRFVVVVQVAPYDVASIHASNLDSNGPGMEVAKNVSDVMEPLQGLAGIVIAHIVKTATPHLRVINHRGSEGRPMLDVYERRLANLRARSGSPAVVLPFVPAQPQRLAAATARLDDLILRRGASPRIPVAERGLVPRTVRSAALTPGAAEPQRLTLIEPVLIEPIMPAKWTGSRAESGQRR